MAEAPIKLSVFKQIHRLMPIPCVDVIVIRNDRVLLVRRNREPDLGKWWVPGGRLMRGESFHGAALRIAKKEVGMDVDVLSEVGSTNIVFNGDPFGHGLGTHTVSWVFSCRPISSLVKLDGDHSEFMWWDGSQVFSDIPNVVRELCRKALSISRV